MAPARILAIFLYQSEMKEIRLILGNSATILAMETNIYIGMGHACINVSFLLLSELKLIKGTVTTYAHQLKRSIGKELVVQFVTRLLFRTPKVLHHEIIANILVKLSNFYIPMGLVLTIAIFH